MENTSQSLVSVITRSMDRPTLAETLDSIAAQTYPNIEVIVVDALGKTHSDLGKHCGIFPLRIVGNGSQLTRSGAANLGLDSAMGKYALFLDDDDWLLPDHIARLIVLLSQSCKERVAYSGIRFASGPQSAEFTVINEPFDPIKLKRGNFIPIHAVLFDRSLTSTGCRFDESLEIYEDWDFWLQLSRMSGFLHSGEITAGYRSTGDSGASPSAEEESIQLARERIFHKWKNIWSGSEINQLLAYVSHTQDSKIPTLEEKLKLSNQSQVDLNNMVLEKQTALVDLQKQLRIVELNAVELENRKHVVELENQRHVVELEKQLFQEKAEVVELRNRINEKVQLLHERDTKIHAIYTSTSWKIAAPLRRLKTLTVRTTLSIRKLIFCLKPLIQKPAKIYPTAMRLRYAWRKGGMSEVKKIILQLPYEVTYNDVWINQYRRSFTSEVLALVENRILEMKNPPLISILMPTYNTPEKVLRQAIESVLAQLYPSWELCIADDASTKPHVRRILKEYADLDRRIKISFTKNNAGVSTATNQALEMATGKFVALLDHDDVLEKQALFRIADSVLTDDPDMVYSDEAILSSDGQQVINHVHRPAFSPEYLRACPYIVHLVAFRTSLLRQIAGFDVSLPISQDYDLILRASEKANTIVHIPEILYLWRLRRLSSGHKRKSEVMQTSRAVLSRHLERCGQPGVVQEGVLFNFFDVSYSLQSSLKVAIIIPTKNHWALVRQCIESIVRTVKGISYDIILVDHASDDASSLAYFEQLKGRYQVLRYEGVFNFSAINNWAISHLQGEFTHYLFCNNDIEAVEEGWLEKMMGLCQKADVGIVGAKLLYPDRKMIQHAGVCVGMYGIAEHYGKFMETVLPDGELHPGYHGTLIANREMSAVTAACALMRKDAFERIGGYDESLAVGFGDVDLCLKTRAAGYRVLFCAGAVVIHHESYTRGKSRVDPHPDDSAYFSEKWRSVLDKCDPFYNPNLTLQGTKWEAAQPLKFNLEINRRVWRRPESVSRSQPKIPT